MILLEEGAQAITFDLGVEVGTGFDGVVAIGFDFG